MKLPGVDVSGQFVTAMVLLTSTWGLSALWGARKQQPLAQPLTSIPMNIGEWSGVESPPLPQRFIDSLRATALLARTYHSGQRTLDLFLAYYGDQHEGESMHSPRHCLPGAGWEVLEHSTVGVPSERSSSAINKYVVQKGNERLIVLYWYQSRKRTTASEYAGKFWLVWDGITTGYTAGSIVRVTVSPQDFQQGLDFATSIIRQVQTCFGG